MIVKNFLFLFYAFKLNVSMKLQNKFYFDVNYLGYKWVRFCINYGVLLEIVCSNSFEVIAFSFYIEVFLPLTTKRKVSV